MENEKLLHEEIKSELEALKEMNELGTETYKVTVDGLCKLIDRGIEIDKLNRDADEKAVAREEAKKARELEYNFKVEQAVKEERDRWIKNGLTAAGIIVPTLTAVWGTFKTLKFEETGSVTTIAGRFFTNKLFKK